MLINITLYISSHQIIITTMSSKARDSSLHLNATTPRRFGRGTVLILQRNSVLLIALSRKQTKNAFSDDMYLDLIDLLNIAKENEDISAVVLTGDGPYFSSGADLKADFMPDETGLSRNTLQLPAGQFMMTTLSFPKILAAAVNGPAVGIGVTLLLHCDLCYCAPNATFWIPFTRLALAEAACARSVTFSVPEFCSSSTIIETMGLAKANELLLLGQKIDANTAVQCNICSKILSHVSSDGDPFHFDSIGLKVCDHIEQSILSLPLGKETSKIFVDLLRGKRRERLTKVCKEELLKLDERFDRGDCSEAAMQLNFGKSKL